MPLSLLAPIKADPYIRENITLVLRLSWGLHAQDERRQVVFGWSCQFLICIFCRGDRRRKEAGGVNQLVLLVFILHFRPGNAAQSAKSMPLRKFKDSLRKFIRGPSGRESWLAGKFRVGACWASNGVKPKFKWHSQMGTRRRRQLRFALYLQCPSANFSERPRNIRETVPS